MIKKVICSTTDLCVEGGNLRHNVSDILADLKKNPRIKGQRKSSEVEKKQPRGFSSRECKHNSTISTQDRTTQVQNFKIENQNLGKSPFPSRFLLFCSSHSIEY